MDTPRLNSSQDKSGLPGTSKGHSDIDGPMVQAVPLPAPVRLDRAMPIPPEQRSQPNFTQPTTSLPRAQPMSGGVPSPTPYQPRTAQPYQPRPALPYQSRPAQPYQPTQAYRPPQSANLQPLPLNQPTNQVAMQPRPQRPPMYTRDA